MNRVEKQSNIFLKSNVVTYLPAKLSWFSSYICDPRNHNYTAIDGKIYNFTIRYFTSDVTPDQVDQLHELMESMINSKTVLVCDVKFGDMKGVGSEITKEYYFNNSNQYDKIVNYFEN